MVYNEVDTFFCMVYFYSPDGLNWREMNQDPFPKLVQQMSLIEAMIDTGFPDVYRALTEESDEIDLTMYFMKSLITVFVGEL